MSQVPWFIDLCGILGTVPVFSPVAFVADTLSNQFFFERMVSSTTVSPARRALVTMTQLDIGSEFLQSMLERWGKEEYHLRPPHPNDIANILWDPLLWMRRLSNTEIQNFFTQDQLIIVFSFGAVDLSYLPHIQSHDMWTLRSWRSPGASPGYVHAAWRVVTPNRQIDGKRVAVGNTQVTWRFYRMEDIQYAFNEEFSMETFRLRKNVWCSIFSTDVL